MKKQKKKKIPNLLDLVPVHSTKHRAEIDEEGKVTIFVENKGFFNFIAQKLFKKPRFSQVHLEEFGCFIWQKIDGVLTVKEIADLLHERFGERSEPLYPRISVYMNMLLNYQFIEMKKDERLN